jgi:hypothetical protein
MGIDGRPLRLVVCGHDRTLRTTWDGSLSSNGPAGGDDIGQDIISRPLTLTREPHAMHSDLGGSDDVGFCVADHPGATRWFATPLGGEFEDRPRF